MRRVSYLFAFSTSVSGQDLFLKAKTVSVDDCDVPRDGELITAGACTDTVAALAAWVLPKADGAPGRIELSSDPSFCMDFKCTQTPCFYNGKYGPDAIVTKCSDSSPTFALHGNGTISVVQTGTAPSAGYCIDLRGTTNLQAYPCVGSGNQHFLQDSKSHLVVGGGPSKGTCIIGCANPPPPPPPAFCPLYHPIHAGNVYDPSGPLYDSEHKVWHQWEDAGGWSHWTSEDLVHWNGSFSQSTHFGGDTGSVSPTPAGVYAFYPIMSGPDKGCIGSATAADEGLTTWENLHCTIPMPTRINTGYRDPVRAFEYNNKWWVGVGCGNKDEGAQFCLFEAEDATLQNFTDRGSLYTTNITFGEVDGNIVWQPNNVSADMMECPDLFPLGDKWVLIGSLYKTNQWWVGTLSGDPPRFTPENVGILDYGNGYAAKTGSEWVQSGSTRRLVFGFTGWAEPTMVPGCGRTLIHARELGVAGSELTIAPIPELDALRKGESLTTGSQALATGSQVEIRYVCTGAAAAAAAGETGKVGIRTLASEDGASYTEIGYDFGKQAMYADHSKCCATANSIVQRASLPVGSIPDDALKFTIFVDGGLIEAFLSDRKVITPLVSPDASKASPEDRRSTVFNDVQALTCTVESWQLSY